VHSGAWKPATVYSKYEVSANIWELFPQLEDLRIFILYKANVKRRMNADDAGGNEWKCTAATEPDAVNITFSLRSTAAWGYYYSMSGSVSPMVF